MARYKKGSTPKLTNKLIQEIVNYIKMGSYVETAAAAAGISKDTFYRWLKNAKKEDASPLERKLSDAVEKALAIAELRDLDVIDRATQGPNGWKAAAWRLERKSPKKWGRQAGGEDRQKSNSITVCFVDPNGTHYEPNSPQDSDGK